MPSKPKKPTLLHRTITVRVTLEEHDGIQATAYGKGQYMSPFMRDLAVKAAKRAGNL